MPHPPNPAPAQLGPTIPCSDPIGLEDPGVLAGSSAQTAHRGAVGGLGS